MKATLLKSWRSSLIGVAAIVKGALIASQGTSLGAVIHDPHFQMCVAIGFLGLLTKDGTQ